MSVRTAILARMDDFNQSHPWSHNDHYQRWVLRRVPAGASRVLDVGCGTGNLVRALSRRAASVDGIDSDEATVRRAERRLSDVGNVRVTCAGFAALGAEPAYDAITAVAVVHHLPLRETLTQMRDMLRPGGRVIIVGCYREATAADRAVSTLALLANPVIGFLKRSGAADARVAMSAPTEQPVLSLEEIRSVASEVFPGSTVRRKLFWRYGLTWKKSSRAVMAAHAEMYSEGGSSGG